MRYKKPFSLFLMFSAMVLFLGFTVEAQTITVTSPVAGADWCLGQTYSVTWTKSGAMNDQVKLRLWNSTNTTKILDIVNATPNNGSYSWAIPATLAPGDYIIRVVTVDQLVTGLSGVFTIADCSAPTGTITVNQPALGAEWCKNQAHLIQWTKSGTMHAQAKIRLWNSSNTTKVLDIVDSTPNDGSYSWTIPNTVANGNYRIRIVTVDQEVIGLSNIFMIKTCDDDDTGINWDAIRDKIRKIIEAEIVPWWRIRGPWPWPPDPNPCVACEFQFDFNKLREKLNGLGLKGELRVELFAQDGKLGDLGMIGKGRQISTKFGQSKLSQRLQKQLVSGKGFKLVFKNKVGEIVHTQAIVIQEQKQMKQMR